MLAVLTLATPYLHTYMNSSVLRSDLNHFGFVKCVVAGKSRKKERVPNRNTVAKTGLSKLVFYSMLKCFSDIYGVQVVFILVYKIILYNI